jgi:hypothetical protein
MKIENVTPLSVIVVIMCLTQYSAKSSTFKESRN